MKKVSNIRLSLRKFFTAAMAVGPIAVLPAPVWAAVPATQQFTATSGSATWSTSGANNGTVSSSSEKTVLVWNAGQFNIAAGDTFNFNIPASGAVLNKVGYTTAGALAAADNVLINGTLFSTGKVFVLANGAITIGGTASVTTNGGLFLSTIEQGNDFDFITQGSLGTTGASKGAITIGGGAVGAGNSPSISGLLDASAGNFVINQASVNGDVIIRSLTAASALNLAAVDTFAAGGNLTVSTNAGAISATNAVTSGAQVTGNQTASFSTGTTGGVGITLNHANNDFEIVSVSALNANSNVTLVEKNILTLGASTIGGNLDVTAAGTADSTAIGTSGTLAIAGDAKFTTTTSNSGVNVANDSTVGGNLFGATNNSNFTFNGLGNITIGSTGISTVTGNRGNISVTTNGTLNVNSALTATGNGSQGGVISLRGGSITTTAAITQTAGSGSAVTLNATSGNIAIGGTVSGARAVLTTAGGSVTQTAAIVTTNATAVSSISVGTGTATLNNAANDFAAGQTLRVIASSASVTNTKNTVLGNSTVTGNLSLTTTGAATIQIGQGAGTAQEPITVGGTLSATTAGGAITDQDYGRVNIFGGLNLTTNGGAITLDAATANGALAPNVQYGVINANAGAGAVSISETTSLNLGTVTASTLTARSTAGSIVDSGVITTTGIARFIVPAAETVVLDVANHNINTVVVQGGNANSVLVGAAAILGGETSVTGNLTLTSSAGNITLGSAAATASVTGNLSVVSAGTVVVNNAVSVTGNLAINAADATAAAITDSATGLLVVTGNTTLKSAGGITLDSAGNDFNSLIFDGVALDARVDDKTALTVSGLASALVDVRAGANAGGVAAAWNLQIGNLTAGSLSARAQDGGGGNSGTITQMAGTTIRTENAASFSTDNANIVINNTGNNFGRVNANTNGNGGITLREAGTLKLGAISNNGTATMITSETGSIIEDTAVATSYTTTNATVTLSAPAGNIQLGRATTALTVGASTTLVASAPVGSVQLFSSAANLTLGNITANSFSVLHTGGGNLTQSGWIRSFGAASFTSGGNMIISNTTNNFGRVSLIADGGAAKNITITEAGSLNLGTVTMPGASTGNFTATSVNGDIIDTGLGGVKLGGVAGATPNVGSGIVSLIAASGNIVLDDPTTDFATTGGVVFNGGNVTLAALGQTTIWLGASGQPSTAGNLTVSSAIGSISNSGNLTVTGNASFQAGAGNIALGQSANQFGSLKFVGNQVAIAQTNNMNVLTGSSAIGNASLASTGGNITITNVGGGAVSFGGTANLSATGSIILPKLVQAVGVMKVTAAGTKDLSRLSQASDLSNKAPVDAGTGTYLPPQP